MVFYEAFSQCPPRETRDWRTSNFPAHLLPVHVSQRNAFFEVGDVNFLLERRATMVDRATAPVIYQFESPPLTYAGLIEFSQFTFETEFPKLRSRGCTTAPLKNRCKNTKLMARRALCRRVGLAACVVLPRQSKHLLAVFTFKLRAAVFLKCFSI